MSNDKTGGPAFPLGNTPEEWMNGMTLRDYFAGQALSGILASGRVNIDRVSRNEVAMMAYKHANAMIKASEVHS